MPKAWHDEKLEDIKANPSKHQHSYEALIRCSTNPDGAIDTDVMEMLRHDYTDMKDVVNPAG